MQSFKLVALNLDRTNRADSLASSAQRAEAEGKNLLL
jgi:hypothetical protein